LQDEATIPLITNVLNYGLALFKSITDKNTTFAKHPLSLHFTN